MTEVHIAPDVADRIGTELADRIRRDPSLIASACHECDQALGAEPVAVLVILAADQLADSAVALAHARCAPSEVRIQATGDAEAGTLVTVIAQNWPAGIDTVRPTLWVSFDLATLLTDGGEGQDLALSFLLGSGWHLVTRLGRPPAPIPGWSARFTMTDPSDPATTPGRFELLDPAGACHADIPHLQQGDTWLPAVVQSGMRCAIYAGSLNLRHPGRAGDGLLGTAQQAAREGHLAGGTIHVDVRLPDGRPLIP
jgi:hypothetical protein